MPHRSRINTASPVTPATEQAGLQQAHSQHRQHCSRGLKLGKAKIAPLPAKADSPASHSQLLLRPPASLLTPATRTEEQLQTTETNQRHLSPSPAGPSTERLHLIRDEAEHINIPVATTDSVQGQSTVQKVSRTVTIPHSSQATQVPLSQVIRETVPLGRSSSHTSGQSPPSPPKGGRTVPGQLHWPHRP
jgi:hypothetical protein